MSDIEKSVAIAHNNAASTAEVLNLEEAPKKGKKNPDKKTQYPLMLKKTDHALFKKYAARKNISFNQFCIKALTFYCDKIADELKAEVTEGEERLKTLLKIAIKGLKDAKACKDKNGLNDILKMADDIVFSEDAINNSLPEEQ